MRGDAKKQLPMYFVINVEAELAPNNPLRAIKRRADAIQLIDFGKGSRQAPVGFVRNTAHWNPTITQEATKMK